MSTDNPVAKAIDLIGLQNLAAELGVTYQAIRKWEKKGMPRTEWSGETSYSEQIASLTGGKVTKKRLLGWTLGLRAVA